ncbi:unnamed protein product, partial [marine sediment metagenome]
TKTAAAIAVNIFFIEVPGKGSEVQQKDVAPL